MEAPTIEGCSICVVAWNPNGIRALFDKAPGEVQRLIANYSPDIIIWNEIKGNRSMQSTFGSVAEQVMPGYRWLWNFGERPGHFGVCVAVKPNVSVISCDYGFGDHDVEPEGRLITLELPSCYLVGLYGVNAGTNRLQYKIEWFIKLTQYLKILKDKAEKNGKIVVAMGDWNIAPTDADVFDPEACQGCSGFLPEEKELWKMFIKMGWIDVYRYLNPNPIKTAWTWGHRTKSKDPAKAGKMYNGWRLDHAVIDQASIDNGRINLQDPNQCQFSVLADYKGSDHAPILFRFKLSGSGKSIEGKIQIERESSTAVATAPLRAIDITSEGGRHRETSMIQPPAQQTMTATPKYHLPTVVCLKRKKTGEVVQGCDVYVGRRFTMGGWNLQESLWANPFKVSAAEKKDPNAMRNCLVQYEAHIRNRIAAEWAVFGPIMQAMVTQGRSLTLGCFCKKSKAGTESCHGDVIVKILREFVATLPP